MRTKPITAGAHGRRQVFQVAVILKHPGARNLVHDELVEEGPAGTGHVDVDEMVGDDHLGWQPVAAVPRCAGSGYPARKHADSREASSFDCSETCDTGCYARIFEALGSYGGLGNSRAGRRPSTRCTEYSPR